MLYPLFMNMYDMFNRHSLLKVQPQTTGGSVSESITCSSSSTTTTSRKVCLLVRVPYHTIHRTVPYLWKYCMNVHSNRQEVIKRTACIVNFHSRAITNSITAAHYSAAHHFLPSFSCLN